MRDRSGGNAAIAYLFGQQHAERRVISKSDVRRLDFQSAIYIVNNVQPRFETMKASG
jgi:hypothetical protein